MKKISKDRREIYHIGVMIIFFSKDLITEFEIDIYLTIPLLLLLFIFMFAGNDQIKVLKKRQIYGIALVHALVIIPAVSLMSFILSNFSLILSDGWVKSIIELAVRVLFIIIVFRLLYKFSLKISNGKFPEDLASSKKESAS